MEQPIDYNKVISESKRLMLLNEIVAKEISEKSELFDKSLIEIKNGKKNCNNCGSCKCPKI